MELGQGTKTLWQGGQKVLYRENYRVNILVRVKLIGRHSGCDI